MDKKTSSWKSSLTASSPKASSTEKMKSASITSISEALSSRSSPKSPTKQTTTSSTKTSHSSMSTSTSNVRNTLPPLKATKEKKKISDIKGEMMFAEVLHIISSNKNADLSVFVAKQLVMGDFESVRLRKDGPMLNTMPNLITTNLIENVLTSTTKRRLRASSYTMRQVDELFDTKDCDLVVYKKKEPYHDFPESDEEWPDSDDSNNYEEYVDSWSKDSLFVFIFILSCLIKPVCPLKIVPQGVLQGNCVLTVVTHVREEKQLHISHGMLLKTIARKLLHGMESLQWMKEKKKQKYGSIMSCYIMIETSKIYRGCFS